MNRAIYIGPTLDDKTRQFLNYGMTGDLVERLGTFFPHQNHLFFRPDGPIEPNGSRKVSMIPTKDLYIPQS